MKISPLLPLIIMVILLTASCASQKKIMNSYMGATKQQVLMGFGPPSGIEADGNGGEILVYSYSTYMPGSTGLATVGADNKVYQGAGRAGYSINRSRTIYINSENKVYYWRIN